MPSAEEDHDHDLPCYTRRRSDYHHRWIFWAVNAAPRQIQRSCRRVCHRETSATCPSPDKSARNNIGHLARSKSHGRRRLELRHCQRQQQQQQQQQQWRSIAMLSTGLLSARAAPRPTDRRCILPSVTLTR